MSGLGKRIRWIRSQKRLTLKQLAKATGLTISFLSQVERGTVSPSIDSLRKIAHGFHLSVGALFDEQHLATREVTLVRKGQRQTAVASDRPMVETLAGGILETAMEPRLVRLPVGATYRPAPGELGSSVFGFICRAIAS